MNSVRHEVQAAFAREQAGLGELGDARLRLLGAALEEARRPHFLPRLASAAATVAVAAAIAVFVLLTHGHGRPQPSQPISIPEALSSGPAAAIPSTASRSYIWLTGPIVKPSGSNSGQLMGVTVDVIDAGGRLRSHFDVPGSQPRRPNEIQSISADGTRALLDDGTVIDEAGHVVGHLPALATQGMMANTTEWMDDAHICATISNQPAAVNVVLPPKPLPSGYVYPTQPYQLPTADHSVTLRVLGLDGTVRVVATVGRGPQGVPSGPQQDSTSVLGCSGSTDIAVIARYHDADTSGGQTSTNMTVSLWAIKLSTGAVLYHQPPTRMALGRAFFFGSQNAQLAVEFLWNSKVAGSETDVVLRMPSGQAVPVLDAEPIPDTPGLSADGTRILRRLVDQPHNQTMLELIDATNGHIIRRVVLPGILGASAVALPGGSAFIVQVENYYALIDGTGGASLMHLDITPGPTGAPGVGLSAMPLQN